MYEAVRSLDYVNTSLASPSPLPNSPPLSQLITVCIDQLSEVRTFYNDGLRDFQFLRFLFKISKIVNRPRNLVFLLFLLA